jgi:hypothetical protein
MSDQIELLLRSLAGQILVTADNHKSAYRLPFTRIYYFNDLNDFNDFNDLNGFNDPNG